MNPSNLPDVSERELRKEVDIIVGNRLDRKRDTEAVMQLFHSHIQVVIGEDEKESGYGKRDGEYEMHVHRNDLRAEQRQRAAKYLGKKEV